MSENKYTCWYCDVEFGYGGKKYRDVECPNCGILNSIYNPQEILYKQVEGQREEIMSPNVNDLNEFICASDVEDGELIEFIDAGTIEERDFSAQQDGSDVRKVLNITVELRNGKRKMCSPNKTSRKAIAEGYGPDSESWIGKKARVEIIKQLVMGVTRQVIYLKPVTE